MFRTVEAVLDVQRVGVATMTPSRCCEANRSVRVVWMGTPASCAKSAAAAPDLRGLTADTICSPESTVRDGVRSHLRQLLQY